MLFDVFRIEMPKWYPDFVSARSSGVNYYPMRDEFQRSTTHLPALSSDRVNLVDQYLTMILIVFIEAGLLEALIEVIQESLGNKSIITRATILVGEILELSNKLLPTSYGIKIQSLPSLFKLASDFKDENGRLKATIALTHIDNLHKNKEKLAPQIADDATIK